MLRALGMLVCLALPAPAEVYLTREQALQLAFPGASARAERQTTFSEAERAEVRAKCGSSDVPATLGWWRFERAGECLGYACIDDVLGKAQPITFLLATDPALRIRGIEILAYRETHGGEIRRADWRAQFAGKDGDAPLRVGRDVRNIAGATISCRNLTNGVRVRLELLRRSVAREPRAPAAAVETRSPAPTRRCQLLMGTTLAVTLDAPDEGAFEAAFAEVRRLEGLLSDWQPQSQLGLLNRAGSGETGPELEEVLDLCLAVARETQGAFDPSVGALVQLWRRARADGSLPAESEQQSARATIGWQALELDRGAHRARLSKPGMALDLGGIGKGYALDRAAAVLRARGCSRALLDFGGQLLALDAPAGRRGWPVAVRDPRGGERPLFELELCRASLSTSADDELGFELGGRRISHILDPRSGAPVEGRLCACVLAPDGARADAWSTALYVLGAEAGLPLAEHAALAAAVLEGDGSLEQTDSLRRIREEQHP
jgi:thiamine biosynthesis lipoprotein